MKMKKLKMFVFLTQGIGGIFYGIFLAAFYFPMPSNDTLIGNPIFRTPMSIFGIIFIVLVIASIVASYLKKPEVIGNQKLT